MAASWQRQQPLLLSVLLSLGIHVAALLLPLAPGARPELPAGLQVVLQPALPVASPAAVLPSLPAPEVVPLPAGDIAEQAASVPAAAVPAGEPAVVVTDQAASAPLADAMEETSVLADVAADASGWLGLPLEPYYPAAELDVLAAPIGPLLLDYPRVQPQPLDLMLYISRDGEVDRVEVLAGTADSDYARYVLASFRQARFMPALKAGVAVRSRKHVRVALQP